MAAPSKIEMIDSGRASDEHTHNCCRIHCCAALPTAAARVPQPQIAAVYDRLAAVYDIWGQLTESKARARALALAAVTDGQTILEVAVGTGLAFEQLVRRNPNGRNIGIDLSAGMLVKARQRMHRSAAASQYDLAVGTAFDLPVEPASVDILMNNYMFDLMSDTDTDRALRAFKRALKPDGQLILVNMTHGQSGLSRLYDRLYRLSPHMMGGCRGVLLSTRLQEHGFVVKTREYHQQLGFPSEVIVAYLASATTTAPT